MAETLGTVTAKRAVGIVPVFCDGGNLEINVPILVAVPVVPNPTFPDVDVQVLPLTVDAVDFYVASIAAEADGSITIHLVNDTVNGAPGSFGLFRVTVTKE